MAQFLAKRKCHLFTSQLLSSCLWNIRFSIFQPRTTWKSRSIRMSEKFLSFLSGNNRRTMFLVLYQFIELYTNIITDNLIFIPSSVENT